MPGGEISPDRGPGAVGVPAHVPEGLGVEHPMQIGLRLEGDNADV